MLHDKKYKKACMYLTENMFLLGPRGPEHHIDHDEFGPGLAFTVPN
jgi:hypothetical protein